MERASNQIPNLRILTDILKEDTACTLRQAQELLRSKGLPFAATSWAELREKRLVPALEKGDLNRNDIIDLLRVSEEYGHQHVYLFRTSTARVQELTQRGRIQQLLTGRGDEDVLSSHRIVNVPDQPQITDVRWDDDKLVIKIVEPRVLEDRIEEPGENGERVIRLVPVRKRTVTVFSLHADGLLELRIRARSNKQNYEADIENGWNTVGEILPRQYFEEESLVPACIFMTENWERKQEEYLLRVTEGMTPQGRRILFASQHKSEGVLADEILKSAVDGLTGGGTYYDAVNAQFQCSGKEVNVKVGGRAHEFVLRAPREHYDHVLARLREYNSQ